VSVPDYYTLCENAVTAVLSTDATILSDYCPQEWQISNSQVGLQMGGSFFAFIRPGQFPSITEGDDVVIFDWQVVVELFSQFTEFETAWEDFKGFRWAVTRAILANRTLGDIVGVVDSTIESTSEPQPLALSYDEDDANAEPNFIYQELLVTVRQRIRRSWLSQ